MEALRNKANVGTLKTRHQTAGVENAGMEIAGV